MEWEDLRFANPCIIEDGGYQYVHTEPQLYWEKDVAEFWRHPSPAFLDVRIVVADLMKEFRADDGPGVASKPKANAILLSDFLNKTATVAHTKPQLLVLARQEFRDHHITDLLFDKVYKKIPANQKRGRGDHARTLRLKGDAKG